MCLPNTRSYYYYVPCYMPYIYKYTVYFIGLGFSLYIYTYIIEYCQ